MALEAYCAACTYMGESADYDGKYYCDRKGERRYACDPKCYSFCEAYSRSNYARENMYENSRSHSGSGCYLTTALCSILNLPDDNYYLQTLRTFRDKVLKQDIKYFSILYTYDKIGPEIANKLKQDKDKEIIAKSLLNNYINIAVTAIENEKNNDAVNIYIAMTTALADRYNINTNIIIPDPKTIDFSLLGHGRTRKKELESI